MQEKTFFLENQETSQSQQINFKIPIIGTTVNLQQLIEKVPGAHKKIFMIYSPEKNQYIQINTHSFPNQTYIVSRDLLKLSVLMIKYRDNPNLLQEPSQSSSEQQNKKERSRQRTIQQVIQLVQKWRQYHDNPPDGKRRTLQEASKIVGVSKKSLDDYYYQLRIGEKHDFDFNSHLDDKIGALRAFIKIKQPQRKVEGKNAKHPKKLKIIQQFSEKLKITDGNSNSNSADQFNQNSLKVEDEIQNKKTQAVKQNSVQFNHSLDSMNDQQIFWEAPFTPLSQQNFIDFQQNFYDDFNFILDDPLDPYLPFTDLLNKKSNLSQDLP